MGGPERLHAAGDAALTLEGVVEDVAVVPGELGAEDPVPGSSGDEPLEEGREVVGRHLELAVVGGVRDPQRMLEVLRRAAEAVGGEVVAQQVAAAAHAEGDRVEDGGAVLEPRGPHGGSS